MRKVFINFNTILLAIFALLISDRVGAQGLQEGDLFPFDQRHLTYPDFKSDLDFISSALTSRCCIEDEGKLSDRIRNDYKEACTFPKLVEELRQATKVANQDFANGEIETRTNAQFIDLEYGWLLRTSFSLSNSSHKSLLRLILIKVAMQMAVDHISALWMQTDLHGSSNGRLLILPKFSAGLERDVILARSLHYASAIRCSANGDQIEEACVRNKLALTLPLNLILAEFQAPSYQPEPELQPYFEMSQNFRAALKDWLDKHNSPTQILSALVEHPEDLVDLDNLYAALVDLPKRIHAKDISAMAARLNIHRYIGELKPADPIFNEYLAKNEPVLTPEIIGILAKIRKQLSNYYQ